MSTRAYKAGFKAAQADKEYLGHRSGRRYALDIENTQYLAGWVDGLRTPRPVVQAKISAPPAKERRVPESRLTLDENGNPKSILYHVYRVTGEHLGDVTEFSAKGAIAWAAFWFNVAKEAICAADIWVDPETIARMNREKGRI